MRKYLCAFHCCQNLVDAPDEYCEKHKMYETEKKKPFEKAERYNEPFYHTAKWQKLRKEVLKRDKYCCSVCGSKDNLEIHHLTPPRGNEELFFDESNMITVCAACHNKLTAVECAGRKKSV